MCYENSVQCQLLETYCCVCGKELVDSISVQLGIGPDCRQHVNQGISPETQKACNVLTHDAAVAAQEGNIVKVRKAAEMIRDLGLDVLADKILERFKNAERLAKIKITETEGGIIVKTPHKQNGEFVSDWRAIAGRRYRGAGKNFIPTESKRAVWELIKKWFPDIYGVGPQGTFKVPKHPKTPKHDEAA
jgi:hypothetical protein